MDVEITRHHEMIPNEDGSAMHEHLFVLAIARDDSLRSWYALDAGRSEIEEDPFFAEKIELMEKLAAQEAQRTLREALLDNVT